MRDPSEIRRQLYQWCVPKSLGDALSIAAAVVATVAFLYSTDFGPWRPIVPLLAVAMFCGALGAILLVRLLLYGSATTSRGPAQDPTTVGKPLGSDDEPQSFVDFTLPGSWAEPGFRHRSLGVDGQHELLAEQVYLRVKAKRKMQNVRIKIAARHTLPDALEPLAEIEALPGVVTKEWEQSFLIMQRTYWNVPAAFTDPSTGQQAIRSIRVDKEVSLFPENPRRFLGEIGHLYYFRATVHHDEGPDEGAFAIEVTKRRDGPQSIFKLLKNIKPVSK